MFIFVLTSKAVRVTPKIPGKKKRQEMQYYGGYNSGLLRYRLRHLWSNDGVNNEECVIKVRTPVW